MEYTVHNLARLAGVSARTVRYYDEIGILKPARINTSGYRIYGQDEVDRLQQILFYRELGVKLSRIKRILSSSDFDELKALKEHREKLLEKQEQLELLIANVEKSIESKERGIVMSDEDKFEGFKEKMIAENERKYGKEIRKKYGEESVLRSNNKLKKMSREEYEKINDLGDEILDTLKAAVQTGNPAGELAQKTADLHRKWLTFYWDTYTREAHAGIVRMYLEDERFKSYYDKVHPEAAEFLRDAVLIYTGIKC